MMDFTCRAREKERGVESVVQVLGDLADIGRARHQDVAACIAHNFVRRPAVDERDSIEQEGR